MATLEAKTVCKSCQGTGLYVGMAEKPGCAVECTTCKGTGCHELKIHYETFSHKMPRTDVERVFKKTCGYCHGAHDVKTEYGEVLHFSQFGCTYEEWVAGVEPKPMKELYCPYLWEDQMIQNSDHRCHKTLYKEWCSRGLNWGAISRCTFWGSKADCWKIYEENKEV